MAKAKKRKKARKSAKKPMVKVSLKPIKVQLSRRIRAAMKQVRAKGNTPDVKRALANLERARKQIGNVCPSMTILVAAKSRSRAR